jgi:ATP-dependent Clp protease protease subunit
LQADDIQNEAKELLRVRNYLYNQLSRNTGQPVEKVSAHLSNVPETWERYINETCISLSMSQIAQDLSRIKRFGAQEALDYGLIDRIVRPRRIKPDAPKKQSTVGLG